MSNDSFDHKSLQLMSLFADPLLVAADLLSITPPSAAATKLVSTPRHTVGINSPLANESIFKIQRISLSPKGIHPA